MPITLQADRSYKLVNQIGTKIFDDDLGGMQGEKGECYEQNKTYWFEHTSKINYNRGQSFNKRVNT